MQKNVQYVKKYPHCLTVDFELKVHFSHIIT